jgi:hypothetical protein
MGNMCKLFIKRTGDIYGDEAIAQKLREERNHELKYNIKVV